MKKRAPNPFQGSQMGWDYLENSCMCSGPHIFRFGRGVKRIADGAMGKVIERRNLTAKIQLDSGEVVEIEQFSPEWTVI